MPLIAPRAARRAYGVLLADAGECLRDVLDVGLRQRGFSVRLAVDGQEMLDLYRRHRDRKPACGRTARVIPAWRRVSAKSRSVPQEARSARNRGA